MAEFEFAGTTFRGGKMFAVLTALLPSLVEVLLNHRHFFQPQVVKLCFRFVH